MIQGIWLTVPLTHSKYLNLSEVLSKHRKSVLWTYCAMMKMFACCMLVFFNGKLSGIISYFFGLNICEMPFTPDVTFCCSHPSRRWEIDHWGLSLWAVWQRLSQTSLPKVPHRLGVSPRLTSICANFLQILYLSKYISTCWTKQAAIIVRYWIQKIFELFFIFWMSWN